MASLWVHVTETVFEPQPRPCVGATLSEERRRNPYILPQWIEERGTLLATKGKTRPYPPRCLIALVWSSFSDHAQVPSAMIIGKRGAQCMV